jgi:hypothetical protein
MSNLPPFFMSIYTGAYYYPLFIDDLLSLSIIIVIYGYR